MNVKAIIFSEFFRYFRNKEDYVLCINHLDELKWIRKDQLAGQFEYFPLETSEYNNIEKKINHYLKNSSSEKEKTIRQTVRTFLRKRYENQLVENESGIDSDLLQKLERIHFYYHDPYLQKFHIDRKYYWIGAILLLLAASFYFFLNMKSSGKLLVSTGSVEADVYLDTLWVGKSNQIIELTTTGYHRISVRKKGFLVTPSFRRAIIKKDSLTRVSFNLIPRGKEKYGYLKINTNVDEANIFIDDEYLGNLIDFNFIKLLEGEHKIELRKYYYSSDPPFRFVTIHENDTTVVNFNLTLPSNEKIVRAPSSEFYSLEILSNVPGARIYLNGKETEYTTDHIFTDLKPGRYTVSLKKEGYKFSPENRQIVLSKQLTSASIQFTGHKVVNTVYLKVVPQNATLIIDRKIKATGSFTGQLMIGKHEIAFEVPAGYAEMEPQELWVEAGNPVEKTYHLVPEFDYYLRISDNGNLEKERVQVRTGYIEEVRGFKYSSSVGPEVVFDKNLNMYAWKFGFAFPYRNPQGSDAVQITFTNRFELDALQNVKLIILAGITGEKYPMHMVQRVSWRVVFNNFKLHELQQINTAKSGELVRYVWDISKLMRYGPNMLEISPTEKNNTFIFIKEIRITNQE